MTKLLLVIAVFSTLLSAQRTTKLEVYSGGTKKIDLNGAGIDLLAGSGLFVVDSGVDIMELVGDHLTMRSTGSVSRVELGGYDGVGPVLSYGGRIRLNTIAGASKFAVGHGDSAKADALNGYAVGGVDVVDASRNVTATAYYVESAGVDLMELSGDHLTMRTPSSVSRVEIGGYDGAGPLSSYGGRFRLMTIAGASKFGVGHGDSAQADALNGYAVGGTSVITSGRTGLFPQLGESNNHVTTIFGETVNVYGAGLTSVCGGGQMFATGLNWYTSTGLGCSSVITMSVAGSSAVLNLTGALTTNSLRVITGAVSGHVLTADGSGFATWQAPGGGSSNITTNTSQSGLFGDKQTNSQWTWGTSGGQSIVISPGGNLALNNSSGINKVLISIGGSLPGVVSTFDSGGVRVNGFDGNGIYTNAGINVNGALGVGRFCAAGETIRSPIYVFGVLISGTCAV